MRNENAPTLKLEQQEQPESLLDFEDDTPLVCNRNQDGDKPCESCQ
jgi:hypothetical protein